MSRSNEKPEFDTPQKEDLRPGQIVWVNFDPVTGREQAGHRPAIAIASEGYLKTVTELAMVLPLTTINRGWPNHIKVTGQTNLPEQSWAMTEQPRTISRRRITSLAGIADENCMAKIAWCLQRFLAL